MAHAHHAAHSSMMVCIAVYWLGMSVVARVYGDILLKEGRMDKIYFLFLKRRELLSALPTIRINLVMWFLSAARYEIFGELTAWHHFYPLSGLHYRLMNEETCYVLLMVATLRNTESYLIVFVTVKIPLWSSSVNFPCLIFKCQPKFVSRLESWLQMLSQAFD